MSCRGCLALGLASLLVAIGAPTTARPYGADQPVIDRAIVLASAEKGGEVAAYAIFTNAGAATAIVAAECDCADRVELHFVDRSEPGRGMAKAWPLPLPQGSRTAIEPPGVPRHLMLVGLRRAIAVGDRVALRFQLADGQWIQGAFVAVSNSAEAWRNLEPSER